jgi:hypothetical protein
MGNVALGVCGYLIRKLNAVSFAEIEPYDFFYPTGITISRGLIQKTQLPYNKFYFYRNEISDHDLIFFLSTAQPQQERGYLMAKKIMELAVHFHVKEIFASAAMAVPISHKAEPKVIGTATSPRLLNRLKKHDIQIMTDGTISGLNGLILEIGMENAIDGVCLLGELPLYTIQLNNPRSSKVIIDVLRKVLPMEVDMDDIEEMSRKAEEEIDQYIAEVKASATKADEESESKRGLSAHVKKKIEHMFGEARENRSKAIELKDLLDTYGVFRDYEDRFLDLFKDHDV